MLVVLCKTLFIYILYANGQIEMTFCAVSSYQIYTQRLFKSDLNEIKLSPNTYPRFDPEDVGVFTVSRCPFLLAEDRLEPGVSIRTLFSLSDAAEEIGVRFISSPCI